jgi:REP element-mobilizing transposase RayT
MIPRLPAHHLTDNLSTRLSEWLQQINLAFGFRLEYLAIRPIYLLWISNVSPNTSPAYLIKTVRQQTSQHIFSEFPVLADENPSGDFWAPGYLAITSSYPPSAQVVNEFIEQTRRWQGFHPPQRPSK